MPVLALLAMLLLAAAVLLWAGRDRLHPLAEMRCPRCNGVSHHQVHRDGRPVRPVRCPACGLLAGP